MLRPANSFINKSSEITIVIAANTAESDQSKTAVTLRDHPDLINLGDK